VYVTLLVPVAYLFLGAVSSATLRFENSRRVSEREDCEYTASEDLLKILHLFIHGRLKSLDGRRRLHIPFKSLINAYVTVLFPATNRLRDYMKPVRNAQLPLGIERADFATERARPA
jgi:hypothetical protein